jgi:hypothetical protein
MLSLINMLSTPSAPRRRGARRTLRPYGEGKIYGLFASKLLDLEFTIYMHARKNLI